MRRKMFRKLLAMPDEHFVPFFPIYKDFLYDMFDRSALREGENVFDLGAGGWSLDDVRKRSYVPFVANEYGARYVGIEVRERLANELRQEIKRRNLERRCKVYLGDFNDPKFWPKAHKQIKPPVISNANVVVMYLDPEINQKLAPRLRMALVPGTRVASFQYPLTGNDSSREERKFWADKLVDTYIDSRDYIFTYKI